MKTSEITNAAPLIAIVLPEVLIARDIAMVARSVRPSAQIFLARTLSEAAALLPEGVIEVAFIQSDAATIAASCLGQRLATDGGKVVVLCEETDSNLPQGWKALPFPFVSDDVVSLMADLAINEYARR